jgi:hypothetical protein
MEVMCSPKRWYLPTSPKSQKNVCIFTDVRPSDVKISCKYEVRLWTEFVCFRIRSSSGPF